MSQFVRDFTDENKPTFDRYNTFIGDNDWTEEKSKKEKESGFGIEKGLIESILDRLEYFVKKAEGDMHLKYAQSIIDTMRKPIDTHLKRILKYTEREDITTYTEKSKIKEEIDFQDTLFGARNKIKDRLGKLPIDDNFTESLVVFHDKQLASIPMKEVVENSFFKVKNKVQDIPVDWSVNTSKELYINMKEKDIPPYNPNKHYWEQDKDVLQFWAEEFNKIKDGININGYWLHPFLYFHLNFFKTKIPRPDGKDKIMSPPLRDNEWYYVENYEQARREKKILAITGSRRYSKSTLVSSQTQWRAITVDKAECLVAGGSAKDLGQIEKNLKLSFNNIEEAFRVPLIKKDWTNKAILGLKSAMHTPYEKSVIHIINLDKGGNMSTELLAGYTPDNFVLDEYLKFSFLEALEALKPAIQSPYGWRCVPQLLGCVCAGTKVWTNDGRIVNIEDLKQEEGIVGYDGEGYSKEPITWMKPPAKKPCYKITTEGGHTLECSEDHPLLTVHSPTNKNVTTFKRTDKFKVGDKLFMLDKMPVFGNRKVENARLYGLLIGDGNCSNGSTPQLACGDDEIFEYIDKNFEYNINKEFNCKTGGTFKSLNISGIIPELRNEGLYGLVKKNKRLPEDIDSYNKESLANLLGGYFDADGNVKVYKSHVRICLTSYVKELLEQVKFQLYKFGIHSTINKENRGEGGYGSSKVIYRLYISRKESVKLFRENIKFLCKHKQDNIDKIQDNKKKRLRHTRNNLRFKVNEEGKGKFFEGKKLNNIVQYTIKNIEYIGYKDVYNLTAGATHTYVANGFITSNTGGNEELSRDALKMLSNPEAYDVLTMNWDRLNNMADPDEITWKQGKFGTFVPAQMSVKDGIVKKDTNLQDYLKSDNKELSKINIQVTDWVQANKVINEDRERKSNQPDAIRKEKIYYPIDTEEIFLSGKTNPFPVVIAKKHKDNLISLGDTGKKVDLYRNADGKVCYTESDKDYPLFPYPGGFHESPVTLYEDPPEFPDVNNNLYISGLDDYKHEASDGDSLGSIVVYKRVYSMGEWDDRIVASYHSRPDPHNNFHRNCLMLLELYGAKCFPENEDMDFKMYLDRKRLTDKYLAKGSSFLSDFGLNTNTNREFGWQPTTKNKRALFGQLVRYSKEEVDLKDEKGEIKKSLIGVEKIPDIKILDEIINYKEGGNFDGLTAFMSALGYAHWLDMNYMTPDPKDRRADDEEKRKPRKKVSRGFTKTRFRMFK